MYRLGKIDVAGAWAAAAASMRKKFQMEYGVRGPMTATMATLHDLSIIPVSPWKWFPAENPDVDWTYSVGDPGPFLSEMQTEAFPQGLGTGGFALSWSQCRK